MPGSPGSRTARHPGQGPTTRKRRVRGRGAWLPALLGALTSLSLFPRLYNRDNPCPVERLGKFPEAQVPGAWAGVACGAEVWLQPSALWRLGVTDSRGPPSPPPHPGSRSRI